MWIENYIDEWKLFFFASRKIAQRGPRKWSQKDSAAYLMSFIFQTALLAPVFTEISSSHALRKE